MDEGQTYNPKCNPKWVLNEILGLVVMVAPTAPTTQQNLVIHQFSNQEQI